MLTYVVIVVVCLLPGALLGYVVAPGPDRWIVWSGAPILTLGLIALGISWLPRLGLPSGASLVFVVEILLALAAALTSWLLARRRATGAWLADETALAEAPASGAPVAAAPTLRRWLGIGTPRPRLIDVTTLTVPAVAAVGIGWMMLRSLAYPPGWDAMNHALLTRNMVEAGSTAVSAACTTGPTLPEVSCQFYPLAGDVSWAQGALLSGGHISTAMMAWSVVVGPLALVIAVYAAVRAFGGGAVAAGAAAILPIVIGPMWPSLMTGRPPEAFAPGMSIAVALLAAVAMRGKHPVRFGLVAGLGIAGLAMTHTYEVLFAATLAVAFMIVMRGRTTVRAALAGAGAIVFAMVVTLAPQATAIAGASGERDITLAPVYLGHVGEAARFWLTDLQGYALLGPAPYRGFPSQGLAFHIGAWLAVVCVIASSLCFVVPQIRWARPWFLTLVVWTGIAIWTDSSNSAAAESLSTLWYGVHERLRTMVLPLHGVLVVAGAYVIGLGVHKAVTLVARRATSGRAAGWSAAVAAGLVAAVLVGLAVLPSTHTTLVKRLEAAAPSGVQYPQTFAWLAQHTRKGELVAYDRHLEFMTWSYADNGVDLLFGVPPLTKASVPDYTARFQAWDWLVNNPNAVPSGCLARKYDIRYIVTGSERIPRWPAHYSRSRLAKSRNLTLVYTNRGINVYQVNARGSACVNLG